MTEEFNRPIFYNKHIDEDLTFINNNLKFAEGSKKKSLEASKRLIELGHEGEDAVIYELMHASFPLLLLHDITLDDLYHDSQIDIIVIFSKGIICIETKKLIGDIKVKEDGSFLRKFKNVPSYGHKKEGLYSPYTQNKYHIDAINNLLASNNYKVPIYSLIVAANNKTIINTKKAPLEIKESLVRSDLLLDKINLLFKDKKDILTKEDIYTIAKLLCDNDLSRSFSDDDIIDNLSIALLSYRDKKAKALNYPKNYIFTNNEYKSLMKYKPASLEELDNNHCLEDIRKNLYGKEIIEIIKQYK